MFLNDIYSDYKNEDTQYECKATLDRKNVLGWLKTVAGFANSKGGTFFIGVENGTNKCIGFDNAQIDKEKLFFYHELHEHFPFEPACITDVLSYTIHNETRYILMIKVMESSKKPIICNYEGMPLIFVRRDGFTNGASIEEINNMSIQSTSLRYDNQVTDILFKIDDFKTLSSFYEQHSYGKQLSMKELASIPFFDEHQHLYNGSYLFSDNYNKKSTKVVCSMYKSNTKGDSSIIASNEYCGNLMDCYTFMDNFLQMRMNHGFVKLDNSRIEIDAYPKRALLEAIINALAHRDYLLENSQISVDLFVDRLIISSPGSLYNTGELKPTRNLSNFISRRRNELICSIFIFLKVMEAKGTGFEKIMEDYKDYDIHHQPYIYSKNNQFSIVLPDLTYEKGISLQNSDIIITKTIENQSIHDIAILTYCYKEKRSIRDICETIDVSNSSYFRDSIILNLVKQNLLLKEVKGKTSYYTTNSNFFKIS